MGDYIHTTGFQYHLFIVLAPIVLISVITPLAFVWRQRHANRASIYLILLVVDICGWLVFNTLEQIVADEFWTMMFLRISYPFITTLPVLWFLFARMYEGKGMNIRARTLGCLFVIPLITCVFVFVEPLNHLVWSSVTFVPVASILTVRVSHGPWFWIYMVYVYIFLFLGAVLIFIESLRRQKMFRNQAFWMILGVFIPLVVNTLYISQIVPGLVKDYTPLAFMVSGLAFSLGIFRFNLMELLPIARSTVIEHMKDGIIILDPLDRVIDINNAGIRALGCGDSILGKPMEEVGRWWPDLAVSAHAKERPVRLEKSIGESDRCFLVEYTPINARSGLVGWVLELRDITEEISLLKQIEHMARTDELTGLPNRRHFSDLARSEITRSARYGNSLSVAMLDLDHFKNVNDTYGHQAGDQVLMDTADLIRSSIRDFDVPARVGGEEFVILMPETSEESALCVAERIRKSFEEYRFTPVEEGAAIGVTVSIGITCTDKKRKKDLEGLFRDADKAMYRSKIDGRNRTTVFSETED